MPPIPAGPIPYPLNYDIPNTTYGAGAVNPYARTWVDLAGAPLPDPVAVTQTRPEPITYYEAQSGRIPGSIWRTSNKIRADKVKRIQGFPYVPARPRIVEFIPQLAADAEFPAGVFLNIFLRATNTEFEQLHCVRRPYTAGNLGAGATVAEILNQIIDSVNSDKRNNVVAYPFDSQVPERPNLPFGSPLTNAIRFVAATKHVTPNGDVLQANYDFTYRFEVAFAIRNAEGVDIPNVLPLLPNEIYPIAPPNLNIAEH
ncbi:MAG: hypothetical protein RMM53_13805, partial [Bacteroidia bacterium]|nr:hypothetical protein [Bacteroidia bacterium]